MKFSLRLFFCIIFILSLGFIGYGYILLKDTRAKYAEALEYSLIDASNLISSYLSYKIENETIDVKDIEAVFKNFKSQNYDVNIHGLSSRNHPLNIYVTDLNGKVLFDSLNFNNVGKNFSKWNDVYLTLKGRYGARSTRTNVEDPLSSVFYIAAPIRSQNKIVGVVSAYKPEKSLGAFVLKWRRRIIFLTCFILGLSILVSAVFVFWLSRPINALINYAEAISLGESLRPPELSSSEFNRLGFAFDKMRRALEGKNSIYNYVQHLNHELKSPLTAIKAAAEILKDQSMSEDDKVKFLNIIDQESRRAQHQIEEILEISNLENKAHIENKSRFSFNEVLIEIENSLFPLIHTKKIKMIYSLKPHDLHIEGDRNLLKKVFSHIILNAIEFSPIEGCIGIYAKYQDLGVDIQIMDQGPGVPSYAKTRIFDKLYSLERPSTGRKSSGLGLNYAKEVLALHGGMIYLKEPNQDFQGAHFHVFIP